MESFLTRIFKSLLVSFVAGAIMYFLGWGNGISLITVMLVVGGVTFFSVDVP